MLAKIAVFIVAIIEVLLLLRLILPFVHWPNTVDDWIPKLISVTNTLASPFQPIMRTVDIQAASGGVLSGYTNQLDAGVLVAMIGWGAIAFVVLVLISLVSRAR